MAKSIAELKSSRDAFLTTLAKMHGWDGVTWKVASRLLAPVVGRSEHGLRDLLNGRNHLHPDKVQALRVSLGEQAEFLDPSCLLNPEYQGVQPQPTQPEGRKAAKPIRRRGSPSMKSAPPKVATSTKPCPRVGNKLLLSIREVDGERAIVLPAHVNVTISTVGDALVVTLRAGAT